ncbi:hypothetical protein ROA7023_01931 [Roseisalinus antarcticus]|uniref:DUF1178 domain-containing protein n=2 Tax=Roseisalinus antarcticus TaxID=254357 RepID=A0A1Y5SR98_9RHOB|nr:hypothetical protein ROA7023_01931 [Roseisalinus antarcticus]
MFDSWFQSAAAYNTLAGSGHLSCAVCGSAAVEKDLMAPRVRPDAAAPQTPAKPDAPAGAGQAAPRGAGPLSHPASVAEQAMAELRRKIEAESVDVGSRFVDEARRMHDGDLPKRSIRGEAQVGEAIKLLEDGIPIAPLPFLPKRRAN